jgi:pimeloyl-ACP methyl ester carboxylesterase
MSTERLEHRHELTITGGSIEVLEYPARDAAAAMRAPLVFLHEGLGSIELWRGFPGAVHDATGRRVVVYARHGYGRSEVVTEPRGVDYMHREAIDVLPPLLEALAVEAPVLIGHSDGASISLIHAGTHPGGSSGLVLLAPHVIVEDLSVAGIEQAKQVFESTDMATKLAKYHRDPAATFWGWNRIWLDPAFRDWDLTDLLPAIDVPVLLLQGRDDEYGTMRQLDLIEAGVSGPVTRVELDGARHSPHLDRPDAVLDATVGFLDDHP